MHFFTIIFTVLILSVFDLSAQTNPIEGKYIYSNRALKKTDMANGSIIELRKDSSVFLKTYFHFGGIIVYKGQWTLQGKFVKIFNLKDTGGIEPLKRSIHIDTTKNKLLKNIQIIISDAGKFTDFFPSELTINRKKYFLKSNDTLTLTNKHIKEIEIKVEDYVEVVNLSVKSPVLISITVNNNTQGTLYYYYRDIILEVKKNNKIYYKGVELTR